MATVFTSTYIWVLIENFIQDLFTSGLGGTSHTCWTFSLKYESLVADRFFGLHPSFWITSQEVLFYKLCFILFTFWHKSCLRMAIFIRSLMVIAQPCRTPSLGYKFPTHTWIFDWSFRFCSNGPIIRYTTGRQRRSRWLCYGPYYDSFQYAWP